MSGELEAAGAAVTAGLAAGAIEGREAKGAGEGACLNCGAALTGAYCSACGQAAHAHRSLARMAEEVLHGLFHFDAKAWRTLPMLAFRPGTLTRGYIYGKRARYISPLALFLFTIFLMFFVFAFLDVDVLRVNQTQDRGDVAELQQAREGLARAEAELAAARAERNDGEQQRLQVDARVRAVDLARGVVARLEDRLERATAPVIIDSENAADAAPPPGPPGGEGRWQDRVSQAAKNGDITANTGFPTLDRNILHSLENPDLALYKIQEAAYKFSFLLVPISLPFMWLLFVWKRGLTLYDHSVFVLYSLAFASLVFMLIAMTNNAPWLEWTGGVLLFVGMPAHMFFHLKGAYALGWWSAIWRTALLIVFAVIAVMIFVIAIVLLGLGG